MTADPWALLREARVSVFHDHEYARIFGTETDPAVAAVPKLADLLARIDAALAERQDSETDVVEPVEMRWGWHEVNSPNRLAALLMDGTRVECRKAENNGVMGWAWNAMIQPVGFAPTLDEAKAAAIAAARGLK